MECAPGDGTLGEGTQGEGTWGEGAPCRESMPQQEGRRTRKGNADAGRGGQGRARMELESGEDVAVPVDNVSERADADTEEEVDGT